MCYMWRIYDVIKPLSHCRVFIHVSNDTKKHSNRSRNARVTVVKSGTFLWLKVYSDRSLVVYILYKEFWTPSDYNECMHGVQARKQVNNFKVACGFQGALLSVWCSFQTLNFLWLWRMQMSARHELSLCWIHTISTSQCSNWSTFHSLRWPLAVLYGEVPIMPPNTVVIMYGYCWASKEET